MATNDNWLVIRRALDHKPTSDLWEIELEDLLRGRRRNLLADEESAAEYVEGIVQESTQQSTSKAMLRNALNQ